MVCWIESVLWTHDVLWDSALCYDIPVASFPGSQYVYVGRTWYVFLQVERICRKHTMLSPAAQLNVWVPERRRLGTKLNIPALWNGIVWTHADQFDPD